MTRRKVLLIGWDAADWKVIDPLLAAGLMPNLARLISEGVRGQIGTLHPPISPMLWTSIATGKRPFHHGIHGFSEPTPDGRGVRPVTNLSRRSKALWNILNQNDLRSVVIGWWPSHPVEPINGVMISDRYHRASGPPNEPWHLSPRAVHPPNLHETLAELRMHPESLNPQLVERFIPLASEIDQDRDLRFALFLRTLAECMSMQSAALWLVDNQPWDFFTVYFDAIDHFCHGFMRHHPPRQSWIGERDFALYRNVVSMAYQFHDEMLGALLEKAGQETSVILMSDHGFHSDHLRPASIPDVPAGPTVEHREFGILAMRGAGIKRGEVLYGASVLDLTPTVLTLYGLPVGEDMDGKVLTAAFEKTSEITSIPSWEEVPGADGRHPSHSRLDSVAAHEALEQLIALGYVERPDENREAAVARTIRELRYHLAESYQDAGRHLEAHRIFTELCSADADEQRFAIGLFVSCQALGLREEMRRVVDDLDGRRRAVFEEAQSKIATAGPESQLSPQVTRWRNLARFEPAIVDYLRAQLLVAERRYPEALEAFGRVTSSRPALFLQTADLYLRLRHPADAERLYKRALELDPDSVDAHLGLCRVALRRRRFSDAATSALDALQRNDRSAIGHYQLGLALTGMREYERAADAFRTAISHNPNFPEAHRRLAALLEQHLGDLESAREHKLLALRMRGRLKRPRSEEPGIETSARSDAPLATALPAPLIEETLVVVTGLPRSGTSLLMQMLAAGGMPILSDGLRQADDDNPHGYFEFEPVKNLLNDSKWLHEARGKAIKIVAPLLPALPPGLACNVILTERDIEEVLDSQERMLTRRNQTPQRRSILKSEYIRILDRVKSMLSRRPDTRLLVIAHSEMLANPLEAATRVNEFLGGGLDVPKMAATVDSSLHRNRRPASN